MIQHIYQNTTTNIKVGDVTTAEIPTRTGIWQGDLLSPMMFNIIMGKIIDGVKFKNGYKMGRGCVNIPCYADVAVLIASEDDFYTSRDFYTSL